MEALLRRVVDDVFGADAPATYSFDAKSQLHRAELTDHAGERRVGLRVAYEWFDLFILDLGVSTGLFEYDDVEAEKEAVLRKLVLVAHAYLSGGGSVVQRRWLFGTSPVLVIEVDGDVWRLGRRSSTPHYPK